jgi:preprotein translocase subunit SecA
VDAAGRQGDPGESRFYLSLEDDLMRIFAGDRVQMMMDRIGMEEDVPIEHEWVTRAVENAQKKVEERNFDIRKHLLEYDDVMNQQRKGVYALRRQVLCGQYRSVPTDEEAKAGKVPEPRVQKADEKLAARVKPILEQMVKLHAAEPPAVDATNEDVIAFRDRALAANILTLTSVRYQSVERDVYTWFGCVVDLRKVANEPRKLLELLEAEVALSLTEQRERMLDLVDEMIGGMVTKHCPKDAHWEDWDRDGLARVYQSQFLIPCRPLDKAIDAQTITEQLYADAEAVLLRKEKDFGPENLLRLFRNIYLEEIDRQWIDHLQAMDNLRDGINLRAFGQRDPKKEFKREGFFMFQNMMATITSSVAGAVFSLKHASEEDMQRLEAQRRRDAEIRAGGAGAHPATAQQQAEAAAAAAEAARALTAGPRASSPSAAPAARASLPAEQPKPVPVRREAPKIGRNDPCYCGSGKKYKACHYREDQSASGR